MKLKTTAKTTGGYEYEVTVSKGTTSKWAKGSIHENDWVLAIKGTPGSWYLTTLEENPNRSLIAIDHGAGWYCHNLDALLAEATALLAEVAPDRLTAAEVKAHDDALWARLAPA